MPRLSPSAVAPLALLSVTLASSAAAAAPSVWVIDDGEKIRRDATATPFERGEDNPVWQPGGPVRLFAMKNEAIAFQVVVEADDDALDGVEVDLDALDGPGPARLTMIDPSGRSAVVGRSIERFVEHFVTIERPSGSRLEPSASAGWEAGSGPPAGVWVGPVPDALIPVEHAPPWDPYPMHVSPGSNGIVWVDLNVPRDQQPGSYRGFVEVRAAGGTSLAKIPVELEIADRMLPDRTVTAVAGYKHEVLTERSGRAEGPFWQLLRAHRVVPLHDLGWGKELYRQRSALDGSHYTRERGYLGPAPGLGDGEVALGSHGAFGDPDKATLATVTALAGQVASAHLFVGDVFLWAADENCWSPWGRAWTKALRESDDPATQRVRVGWTCSQDPNAQPVDLPILNASWDASEVRRARADGKTPWVYGGVLPRTGTFLLDAAAVSPRVNGWLQQMLGIPRWFVPEVARWTRDDDTPLDPFEEPETERDPATNWANGGDVLVYPGSQRDAYPERSADVDGVFASIRLKNWRRGIEDAGYLEMARAKDPQRADAVAAWLIPSAMGGATPGRPASWGDRGKPFYEARAALLAIVEGHPGDALAARDPQGASPGARAVAAAGPTGAGAGEMSAAAALVLASVAAAVRRRRMATT